MQWHDVTSIASISNEGRGNGATVATMQLVLSMHPGVYH